MVDKRRSEKSGRKSGKRGILSTKGLVSLPLRYTFYGNPYHCNNNLPKTSYPLVKSSSYIVRKAKPFQDMTISEKWLFLLSGGVLVVFFCGGRP